ncbi:MAG: ABC transporter substrate-binding protein, partial [Aliihoeflea sp.]
YASILHYLKAVEALGDKDAKAVVEKMKELPTEDALFGNGEVRADGRHIHDSYLFRVKTPEESEGPWDYYETVSTTPAAQAFRPLEDGGCSLVQ